MTFDGYWELVIKASPKLETSERLTLTVEVFRKSLARAFEAGQKSVEGRQKAAEGFAKVGKPGIFGDMGGLFDGLLGGGSKK